MASPTFYELSAIAGDVYGEGGDCATVAAESGWTRGPFHSGRKNFQAAVYKKGGTTVIAFRGTVPPNASDLKSDLLLGAGMNTSHFAEAEEFMARQTLSGDVLLTGHSLGGAIAQIVGNRQRMPFVTFNAPGVAVLASRRMWTANPAFAVIRLIGAAASAIEDWKQTKADIKSAFYKVRGVNVCLMGDPVSQYGVHYGKVIRLMGIGHGIGGLMEKLRSTTTGSETLESYFPA